jgi:hypothetical protein
MAIAAASVSSVVASVAAALAAVALVVALAQLVFVQRERLRLERHALELRLHEQEFLRARSQQQLETERLWFDLLGRQLEAEVVRSSDPSIAVRVPVGVGVSLSMRDRKLAFLARKRIESVTAADTQLTTSANDLSFAADAAEHLGRTIANQSDGR